jgi:hypothetical protein
MNPLAPVLTDRVPPLVAAGGEKTTCRFFEFFAADIRNPHTRRAYARRAVEFFDWLALHGIRPLTTITAGAVRQPNCKGAPLPPLAGEGAPCVSKGRMRGVARRATALSSVAHIANATRIRTTASSVEPITNAFGKRNIRNPCAASHASRSTSAALRSSPS